MGTKNLNSATDLITFTRASSSTFLGSNGLIQTATNNTPRIEYNPDGTVKGLLIEEARTNLMTYSEDFTDASWTKANTATLALDAIGPDGVVNSAVTLVDSNAGGTGYVRIDSSNITTTVGTAHTASIYAKADQLQYLDIRTINWTTPANASTFFNLSTGVVVSTGAGMTSTIENAGNGWYRCSITFTTDDVDGNGIIRFTPSADGTTTTVDLDGTSSILIYGAQFEAGAFPTSYIPTTGSTATRAADVASIPTSAFGYNSDAGSVVAEVSHFTTESGDASAGFAFDDGSTNNRMYYYQNKGQWIGSVSAVIAFNVGAPDPSENTDTKVGAGYKKDNVSLVIDSSIIGNDTSTDIPSVNKFYFGSTSSGNYLNGHIKSIKYYPRRLSNTQLQELTT